MRCSKARRHRPLPLSDRRSRRRDEAQPFYVNSPYGIALAHNGNLINTDALRREVFEQDRRNVNTESDSEVLLNVFAHELDTQKALTPEAAFRAVEGVQPPREGRLRGRAPCWAWAWSRSAIRTASARWSLGKRTTAAGDEYAVASESVALDVLGFERVRDVAPGEGRRSSPRAANSHQSLRRTTSIRPASSSTCTSRARTR
jgi:amidophosphoribosyltransferase